MTRKLFSVLLCAFALLLLMGAGEAPQEQPAAIVAEEESAADPVGEALETNPPAGAVSAQAASASPIDLAEDTESGLTIDGEHAPAEVDLTLRDGVSYVALAPMAQVLDPTAQVAWDGGSGTVAVTTGALSLTAQVGQLYLEANGRYLYLSEGVQLDQGSVMVPLWAVAEAFDADLGWDAAEGVVTVTRGSGAIQSGDYYYDQEDLFWLSRVIDAESGNQPLEGKMAVAIVVMNRVASPIYPDTVEGVLAQKNQFSTYRSGKLAERTPNASSVIAAKLVLDGGVVEEVAEALYFDSTDSSWAARNRECIAIIGGHRFYN